MNSPLLSFIADYYILTDAGIHFCDTQEEENLYVHATNINTLHQHDDSFRIYCTSCTIRIIFREKTTEDTRKIYQNILRKFFRLGFSQNV